MSQFMKPAQVDTYGILNLDPEGNEFSYSSDPTLTEAETRYKMDKLSRSEWNEGHTLKLVKRTQHISYEVID